MADDKEDMASNSNGVDAIDLHPPESDSVKTEDVGKGDKGTGNSLKGDESVNDQDLQDKTELAKQGDACDIEENKTGQEPMIACTNNGGGDSVCENDLTSGQKEEDQTNEIKIDESENALSDLDVTDNQLEKDDNNSNTIMQSKQIMTIPIEVQSAEDIIDAGISLNNIQSEVMLAINSSTGFLDSDPPSVSSDPPSTAEMESSPYKSSLGSNSENLLQALSSNLSDTDLRTDESPSPQNTENKTVGSDALSQNDDDLLDELSEALQSNGPSGVPINGLKLSQEELLDYQRLKKQLEDLRKLSQDQQDEIKKLHKDLSSGKDEKQEIEKERDFLRKQLESARGDRHDSIYEAQTKELEVTIATQNRELKLAKEKLTNHDAAARKTVTSLQNELKTKVEQLTKMFEDCRKEKDKMVMSYAQAEQKNIELQQRQEKMDAKMKEMLKDKDFVISKFKMLKSDREKAIQAFDARSGELNSVKKELEKVKDAYNSVDVKVKWAQNKLKAETAAHQETKAKLDEALKKIKDSREESEQIRRDCQSMIRNYQESEDMKSSNLGQQLKSTVTELKHQQQEKADNEQVHSIVLKELDTLKNKHKDMLTELQTWRDKVKCLDTERQHQEETLSRFKATLQSQKVDNETLRARLNELEDINERFEKIEERCNVLQKENEEVLQSHKDIEMEMQGCSKREAESLIFTQKISDQNAKVKSEKTALEHKVESLTAEHERLTKLCQNLEKQVKTLTKDLSEEQRLRSEETQTLSSKLKEKSKAVEQLSLRVEEVLDENKTVKRKHGANIKDLTRQLQQAKKRLDAYENKEGGGATAGSMGSRTSSSNSLDTVSPLANHGAEPSGHMAAQHELASPQEEEYPTVRVVEVDKQMLIEKIVRLQKAHARKNEKMEFMEDHINQLLEEIRKKTRIIQMYAMREETGTLASERMDAIKAQMAKKTGVMASLYSSHAQDAAMDLPLSLEINHKLQAVLEDTLLKNITLKDNLETLGTEIARLSQENRNIQLKLRR